MLVQSVVVNAPFQMQKLESRGRNYHCMWSKPVCVKANRKPAEKIYIYIFFTTTYKKALDK